MMKYLDETRDSLLLADVDGERKSVHEIDDHREDTHGDGDNTCAVHDLVHVMTLVEDARSGYHGEAGEDGAATDEAKERGIEREKEGEEDE